MESMNYSFPQGCRQSLAFRQAQILCDMFQSKYSVVVILDNGISLYFSEDITECAIIDKSEYIFCFNFVLIGKQNSFCQTLRMKCEQCINSKFCRVACAMTAYQ